MRKTDKNLNTFPLLPLSPCSTSVLYFSFYSCPEGRKEMRNGDCGPSITAPLYLFFFFMLFPYSSTESSPWPVGESWLQSLEHLIPSFSSDHGDHRAASCTSFTHCCAVFCSFLHTLSQRHHHLGWEAHLGSAVG